jgi:hypothetical protein
MKELVKFEFEDGGSIWVEVEETSIQEGLMSAGVQETLRESLTLTFEAALEKIKPVANAIISKLQDLSIPPDQIKAEFGIKMNAKAGAVLATAGGEVNIKVGLSWKQVNT